MVGTGHLAADLRQLGILRSRRHGPTEQERSRNQHQRPRAPTPHGVDVNGHALSPRILVTEEGRSQPDANSCMHILAGLYKLFWSVNASALMSTSYCIILYGLTRESKR